MVIVQLQIKKPYTTSIRSLRTIIWKENNTNLHKDVVLGLRICLLKSFCLLKPFLPGDEFAEFEISTLAMSLFVYKRCYEPRTLSHFVHFLIQLLILFFCNRDWLGLAWAVEHTSDYTLQSLSKLFHMSFFLSTKYYM